MRNNWTTGYTAAELEDAQARYDLVFPSDLVDLLRDRRPIEGHDWRDEDDIRRMLAWPFELLLFDVEHGLWWPGWGERPSTPPEREEVVRHALSAAPRLIPLLAHRFLPETPSERGNPVFSMHGFDTVVYGADLEDYFLREFDPQPSEPSAVVVKHIPFWSDIVDKYELVEGYGFNT